MMKLKENLTGNVSIRDIGAGGVNSLHRSLPARDDQHQHGVGQDVDAIIVSKVDVGDKIVTINISPRNNDRKLTVHKVQVLNVHNVHNSHNGFAISAAGSGVVGGRVVALASQGGAADLCVSSKPRRAMVQRPKRLWIETFKF